MARKRVVVVGSGIAGLVSALLLREKYDVSLVERDAACGGLLKTYRGKDDVPFDYGTHVLGETGNAEVDALVFDRVRDGSWNRFKVIRAGSYFNGRLYARSPHIDIRALPKPLYEKAIEELVAADRDGSKNCADLEESLLRQFGPTVTREVQAPALRKVFGCELKELLPDNPFALKRFVAFDDARSRELKKDPRYDRILAFNSFHEGIGAIDYYYPKKGSMGQLTERICADLRESGVEIVNGRFVAKIVNERGEVSAVSLDDGRVIPCAAVVWTVPPFLLLKALGLSVPGVPPRAMPTGLFYYRFDRPFPVDNHYITCYDNALKIFRVTLFPNLRESPQNGPYNCTVEVIGEGAEARFEPEIRSELVKLGAVDVQAKVLSCEFELLAAGFPALTHSFVAAAAKQAEAARGVSKNILLLGRAKFDSFSTESVMVEAFQASQRLANLI